MQESFVNEMRIHININKSIEISQLKLDIVIKEIRKVLSETGQNLFKA